MNLFKDKRGFTLTELAVTLVISFVVIAAAGATYVAQNRSYVTQESVSEINTQSKVAHDMISNDIKTAGFGVPDDMNLDPINGHTSVITPYDSAYMSDSITIVGAFRRIGTLWPAGGGPQSNYSCAAGNSTEIKMGTSQVSLYLTGETGPNTSDMRYLSFDGVDYAEVTSCVMSGDKCTGILTLDRALRATYPLDDTNGDGKCDTGRPVYLVEDITYCLDYNGTLKRIRRNEWAWDCYGSENSDKETIAENIEDLQFAYALDTDNDGFREDGNFINNGVIADPSSIRTVRVNILAKSDKPDSSFSGLGNPPEFIENREHYSQGDDYRRRWWQKIVTIRNRWGQ